MATIETNQHYCKNASIICQTKLIVPVTHPTKDVVGGIYSLILCLTYPPSFINSHPLTDIRMEYSSSFTDTAYPSFTNFVLIPLAIRLLCPWLSRYLSMLIISLFFASLNILSSNLSVMSVLSFIII